MDRNIKLLSTDFDGTLFAEFENPPIPWGLQRRIGELQDQGVKWAINTGREMASLMEALGRAGVEVEPDYLILVEREIYVHHDSQYSALEEWNRACDRDHGRVFEQVRPELPRIVAWISQHYHARIYEDPYSPFCIITATTDDMDTIHQYLDEFCRTIPELAVVRNDVYARFCHAGYNKGTALAHLSRRLNIEPGHVFAAGDHLNDLPMLNRRYAHLLACPSNAVPQVKATVLQQGGYVSRLSHGEGIEEAINFYAETARG